MDSDSAFLSLELFIKVLDENQTKWKHFFYWVVIEQNVVWSIFLIVEILILW